MVCGNLQEALTAPERVPLALIEPASEWETLQSTAEEEEWKVALRRRKEYTREIMRIHSWGLWDSDSCMKIMQKGQSLAFNRRPSDAWQLLTEDSKG